MKLRNGATVGAQAYYRLIGSVHAGEPVQEGDAVIDQYINSVRDRKLSRYAGAQHRTITIEELRNGQRQDPTSDPQQPAAGRTGPGGGPA